MASSGSAVSSIEHLALEWYITQAWDVVIRTKPGTGPKSKGKYVTLGPLVDINENETSHKQILKEAPFIALKINTRYYAFLFSNVCQTPQALKAMNAYFKNVLVQPQAVYAKCSIQEKIRTCCYHLPLLELLNTHFCNWASESEGKAKFMNLGIEKPQPKHAVDGADSDATAKYESDGEPEQDQRPVRKLSLADLGIISYWFVLDSAAAPIKDEKAEKPSSAAPPVVVSKQEITEIPDSLGEEADNASTTR